jgi:hypothetical protein
MSAPGSPLRQPLAGPRRARHCRWSSARSSSSPQALRALDLRRHRADRHHRHQRQDHHTALVGALCARQRPADAGRRRQHQPGGAGRADARSPDARSARGWVLELSSFQLETTAYPGADGNGAQRHRRPSRSLRRSRRLRRCQGAHLQGEGVQVLNRDDARVAAMRLPGAAIGAGALASARRRMATLVWPTSTARPGWCAATSALLAARRACSSPAVTTRQRARRAGAVRGARYLPQTSDRRPWPISRPAAPGRAGGRAEIDGVRYYDDSKGTNVGATVAALEGLGCKVVPDRSAATARARTFSPLGPVARHARASC